MKLTECIWNAVSMYLKKPSGDVWHLGDVVVLFKSRKFRLWRLAYQNRLVLEKFFKSGVTSRQLNVFKYG